MAKKKSTPNYRLKKCRKELGYGQRTVADKLRHRDTSLISRWERGLAYPSLENALRLSRLYKRLVHDLFFELDREIIAELFPKEKVQKKSKINDP